MSAVIKRTISACLALLLVLSFAVGMLIAGGVSAAAASTYTNELWLLGDYGYGLSRGKKFRISSSGAAPRAIAGNTAEMPLSAVTEYTGHTVTLDGALIKISGVGTLTAGANTWVDTSGVAHTFRYEKFPKKEGEDIYITQLMACDLFGLKCFYNSDIALTVFSYSAMSYSKSYSGLTSQLNILKNLLFTVTTGDMIYKDIEGFSGVDTHPRLLSDATAFDRIRYYYGVSNIYTLPEEEQVYKRWVDNYFARGRQVYGSNFKDDGNGNLVWRSDMIREWLRQPYYKYDENGDRISGDGYDSGGRSDVQSFAVRLQYLAFCWQASGERVYADAFYLYAKELGKWEHWGEGHFLNCADGAACYSVGLDWIWHAFDSEPEKRDELCAILYEKALKMGEYAIRNSGKSYSKVKQDGVMHVSERASSGWTFINRSNNWNTVCNSGMTMAALVLMGDSRYTESAKYVASSCINAVYKCLRQYAPDGAYTESPGYWDYGTNTYIRMLCCLMNSAGTDYGYFDTIGLRQSYYFAYYITNSDTMKEMWNYHDASANGLDLSYFYYVSRAYGDPTIAKMRDMIIRDPDRSLKINADIMDILYYDSSLSEGASELTLDYYMKAIETVTMRTSWQNGSIFTGIHAGPSNSGGHSDLDSGSFYLRSDGVTWFGDPGQDNYNLPNYFQTAGYLRYHWYRKSLEAHNTILIRSSDSSLKLGQVYTGDNSAHAVIERFESDGLGSIAVADMTPQYGSTCTSAKRGLMLTNSRTTVVLQDEIEFSSPTSLTWIAATPTIFPKISEDGRTAYLTARSYDGSEVTLRCSIVSDDRSLRFSVKEDETILDFTYTKADNPLASDPQWRLVIEADGVKSFNVAVVFEKIRDTREIVGYRRSAIADWSTLSDEWVKEANSWIDYGHDDPPVYKYNFGDLHNALEKIKAARTTAERFSLIAANYRILTSIDRTVANVQESIDEFTSYFDRYNRVVRAVNAEHERALGLLPSGGRE